MSHTTKLLVLLGGLVALVAVMGLVTLRPSGTSAVPNQTGPPNQGDDVPRDPNTYTIDIKEYQAPQDDPSELLADDRVEDKKTEFKPELVDRRPLNDWQINTSEAVLRLDVPLVAPDTEAALLNLYPSYAAARAASPDRNRVLPSVNVIDGKAKQFDDGLYAALDQAYYKGLNDTLKSHIQLIKRLYEKVGPASPASAYLAAGLSLAGETVTPASPDAAKSLREHFLANETEAKPIGFYTWSKTLEDCFRFLRYFQQPIRDLSAAKTVIAALREDQAIRDDYRRAVEFYFKLTNPPAGPSILDLVAKATPTEVREPIPLFPSSTSRETELFRRLFPLGLPQNADLMNAFIRKIRSGEVSLKPRPSSGWYDYQIYALETLLLPERSDEHNKLFLTKAYKKRMLEAFKARMTTRRETHVRQLDKAEPASRAAPPPDYIEPRLRVEPCPSYYLRTARGYAFLNNFLESAVGEEGLKSIHGLRKGSERAPDLQAELKFMRELFYGLYLLSAEDIGLEPALLEGETVDRGACEKTATEWLAKIWDDPDLAVDTRVAVPIYVDPIRNVTRLWMTIGVRMTKLSASYARGPRMKPMKGDGDWEVISVFKLRGADYLIPVDEFAEVELKGLRVLNREELRAVCDAQKTKQAIIQALQK
jgi:hypothetical protein